ARGRKVPVKHSPLEAEPSGPQPLYALPALTEVEDELAADVAFTAREIEPHAVTRRREAVPGLRLELDAILAGINPVAMNAALATVKPGEAVRSPCDGASTQDLVPRRILERATRWHKAHAVVVSGEPFDRCSPATAWRGVKKAPGRGQILYRRAARQRGAPCLPGLGPGNHHVDA